jgi:hypothetical protein
MDAGGIVRRAMPWRTTKSCGPGAPGLALSLRVMIPQATVTMRSRTPGRARSSVNTIAQGRPDVSVEPVVTNSCAFFAAHEAAGAASARSSLRPLLSRDKICAELGRESRRENADTRHCEEQGDEAIQSKA